MSSQQPSNSLTEVNQVFVEKTQSCCQLKPLGSWNLKKDLRRPVQGGELWILGASSWSDSSEEGVKEMEGHIGSWKVAEIRSAEIGGRCVTSGEVTRRSELFRKP
jgi:hypothetical protein